jgi:hypothetical protein
VIGYTNEFGFLCLDCTGRLLDSCANNDERDNVLEDRHLEPMSTTVRARTVRCMLCLTVLNHIPHEVEPAPSRDPSQFSPAEIAHEVTREPARSLEELKAELEDPMALDPTNHEGKFLVIGEYHPPSGTVIYKATAEIVDHRPHKNNVVYQFVGPHDWENCPKCMIEAHFVDKRTTGGG